MQVQTTLFLIYFVVQIKSNFDKILKFNLLIHFYTMSECMTD